MSRIFLSHVEEDQAIMMQIASGLENAGYKTWYFERDVLPGTSYLIQITRAIEDCCAMVLIVSHDAIGSDQVTKEVVGAFEQGKDFFPVLVNVTPPELKNQQPEWRHALGGTAMILTDSEDVQFTIESIIEGLKSREINPEISTLPPSPVSLKESVPPHTSPKELKNVTVMFAEISGFSAISEKMDTEELTEIMNHCFSGIKKCIDKHGGIFNEFTGDKAMALFGAPRTMEDAPHRALYAAIEMKKKLHQFIEVENLPEKLNIHIGINTGNVVAGMDGGKRTRDYTVMGETVNLASHIQGYAEKDEILVSESTYRLAEGYFDFRNTGPINIKGTEKPLHLYLLIGPRKVRNRIAACMEKGLTPFKGRELEMAHLMDSYKKTAEGEGQVVGIMGEPGMGKSRLVLEFIQSLTAGEYLFLNGSSQHFGDTIPYLPILDIIRDYLDINDGDTETVIRQKIDTKISGMQSLRNEIIPSLYDILSLNIEDEPFIKLDEKQRRDKVFNMIRMLLITESTEEPLIIAVDDLHWIDNTSEEFLGNLIDSIATTRIMLILQYRPEYIHPWINKTFYTQIQLDHLSRDMSKDLIQAILSDAKIDPELNDLIIQTTSGNPLFMEELTRNLLEDGSIQKAEGYYILESMPSRIRIPDTIQGIIADRLDRLDNNLKKVIQTASIIGREFSFCILEDVVELDDNLQTLLTTLQDLEFIYEKSVFPELEYIFKHALTREVAYNSILLKKRNETHEQAALSIEKIYKARIEDFYEILAYHYSMSGNSSKAYQYYKLSADKAAGKYANNESLQFYKKALQILNEQPENEASIIEKLHLFISLEKPLFLLGFPEGSLEILEQSELLAKELADEKALPGIHHNLSIYHTFRGNLPTAVTYAEMCFNEAEKIGEIELMVQSTDQVCFAYFMKGNVLKSADVSRRVLNLFEEHGIDKSLTKNGVNVYSMLCTWLGGSLVMLGREEEAKIFLDKATLNASKLSDWFQLATITFYLALISYFRGDGAGMITHGHEMLEFCKKGEVAFFHGLAVTLIGIGYYFQGKFTKARDNAENGLSLQKKFGMNIFAAWSYWFVALILSDDPAYLVRATEYTGEALQYAQKIGAKHLEASAHSLLGTITGKTDPCSINENLQSLQEWILKLEELKLATTYPISYLFLGEALADGERKGEALVNLKKAKNLFQEHGLDRNSFWIHRVEKALQSLL